MLCKHWVHAVKGFTSRIKKAIYFLVHKWRYLSTIKSENKISPFWQKIFLDLTQYLKYVLREVLLNHIQNLALNIFKTCTVYEKGVGIKFMLQINNYLSYAMLIFTNDPDAKIFTAGKN